MLFAAVTPDGHTPIVADDPPDSETSPSGAHSLAELPGTVLSWRFRVVEPLGRGGAGQVFVGVQEPLGREVAIKVLRDDLQGAAKREFSARFEREAAVAGRLAHPNVVTIHDYGTTDDGLRYVVMERLKGPSLADLVRGGTSIDPSRAARLIADIAKGLAAAHDAGLVHRDVKPTNVIVVEEDGRERPVLLDFGLVKVTGEGLSAMSDSDFSTRAGTYMGTPAYMAPEQARGQEMDHRADLYALGCVLYRLVAGVIPYTADNALALAMQHMTAPYPPIAERAPGMRIPARLEAIIKRCLEKDPALRHPDARALAAELEMFLAEPSAPTVAPAPARGMAVGAGIGAVGAGIGLVGAGAGILAVIGALVFVVFQMAPPSTPTASPDALQPSVALGPDPAEPLPMPLPEPEPEPQPEAVEPAPAPAPEPEAASAPAPDTAPAGAPQPPPRPASQPATSSSLVVDDVSFTADEAAATLAFANEADAAALRKAGVYVRGVSVVLDNRPFESLEALAATRGIGQKTMESLKAGGASQ
jgi:serine/threonine-protein kinase